MSRLNAQELEVYSGLADALLPASGAFPAASQAGLAATIEQVLGWRPELAADLFRALAFSRGKAPGEAVDALQTEDPQAYATLRLAAMGGYYLDPGVRAALGYDGQISRPVDPDEEPDFLAARLLDPVIARGPIWRRPEDPSNPR